MAAHVRPPAPRARVAADKGSGRLRALSDKLPSPLYLGGLEFGAHGLLGCLSAGLLLLSLASAPPRLGASAAASAVVTSLLAVMSLRLVDRAPKYTVIARGIVAPHREAYKRTIAVMLYVNLRLAWQMGWLRLGGAYAAGLAALAAWLLPRRAFDNANTFVFVVPISLGVWYDAAQQLAALGGASGSTAAFASAWNAQVVTARTLLAIQLAAVGVAFAFTLAFRGLVRTASVYAASAGVVAGILAGTLARRGPAATLTSGLGVAAALEAYSYLRSPRRLEVTPAPPPERPAPPSEQLAPPSERPAADDGPGDSSGNAEVAVATGRQMVWTATVDAEEPCDGGAAAFLNALLAREGAAGELISRVDDSVEGVVPLGGGRYRASISAVRLPGLTVTPTATILVERAGDPGDGDGGLRYTTEEVTTSYAGLFAGLLESLRPPRIRAVTEVRARGGVLAARGEFSLALPLPRWWPIPDSAMAAGGELVRGIVEKDTRLSVSRIKAEYGEWRDDAPDDDTRSTGG